jgi:dCTP deaminase
MSSYILELFPEIARDVRHPNTGVLPSQIIRRLIQSGLITASVPIEDEQIQPASLDLRLGPIAYRLRASFLPGKHATVTKKLADLAMAKVSLEDVAILERGCVYLVPLLEQLRLPDNVSGKANPKSTTGRLDIFTRVITDYGEEFERVPESYVGPLYAEVVPRAFSVLVRTGMRLSQLRLIRGNPPSSDSELAELHRDEGLVYGEDEGLAPAVIQKGLKLSVSLRAENGAPAAYRARKDAPLVDLSKINHYDAQDFWDALPAPQDGRLILSPGDFYILASKEKVSVPPLFAAEMVPFDPSVGEFRIHYAGFFDPGFGYSSLDSRGTRAVLEVRAHEVPFLLEEGQTVGRLIYMRVLERPERLYGTAIGSSYANQQVTLSKQFRRVPASALRRQAVSS